MNSKLKTFAIISILSVFNFNMANAQSSYLKKDDVKLEIAIMNDNPEQVIEALYDGIDINTRGINESTPLMVALDMKKRKAAMTLIEYGADVNLKNSKNLSALYLASENYKNSPLTLLQILNYGGDPNILRPDEQPIIWKFVVDKNCEFIETMKNYGADLNILTKDKDPIITQAAENGDWDMVMCLLELGAKYDYEIMSSEPSRKPLSSSFQIKILSENDPISSFKRKAYIYLKEHNIDVMTYSENKNYDALRSSPLPNQ